MIEKALNPSKILWYQKSVTDRQTDRPTDRQTDRLTDGRNANPMSLDDDVGGQLPQYDFFGHIWAIWYGSFPRLGYFVKIQMLGTC